MQTSIKLKYRPSRVEGRYGSISIQLILHRQVRAVTTPYKIYPQEWDEGRQCIKISTCDLNRAAYLRETALKLNTEVEKLKRDIFHLENKKGCTVDKAIALYIDKDRNSHLMPFVGKLKAELAKNGQLRTARAYQTVLNKLIEFNDGNDFHVDEIDDRLIYLFDQYLRRKGVALNTISFYMRNLRAICNKAIRRNIIERKSENPFAEVYTGIGKTRKRAVRKETIEALSRLDLSGSKNEKLAFSRDMFLLSFYLRGISFIDMAFLKKENIIGSKITYCRSKTGQKLEIALTPEITAIIHRYSSRTGESGYLLPFITPGLISEHQQYESALRTQNNRLRKISTLIKQEPITSYVARHSWASIAWEKGIAISVISQGLGHESEKTTRIYLDSFDYTTLHNANRKIINLIKKTS